MRGTTNRRFIAALCLSALMIAVLVPALAAPQISYLKEEQFDSFVSMPVLIGMENTFAQDSINKAIEEEGNFPFFLATLRALTEAGQTGIRADSEARILGGEGGILSARVDASGRVGSGRPGHSLTPMMFHLTTGERVELGEIFADPDAAQMALEAFLEEELLPDMSSYLDAEALLPLPMERLMLDEAGINFLYDADQLTLLSGWPASLHLTFGEVEELLDLSEGSLLSVCGVPGVLALSEHSRDRIAASVAEGTLPGLPIVIGQSMDEIKGRYPLLTDPDAFPGGIKVHLEDGRFRGVTLTAMDGEDPLSGIISTRAAFAGLVTGKTLRDEALRALGDPMSSLTLDGAAAEQYGLTAGPLDSYVFGDKELALSWDEEGRLYALWIKPAHTP